MDVDSSCYEGRVVQGASAVVMSRGSVVVRDGEFTGRKAPAGSSSALQPTTPGRPETMVVPGGGEVTVLDGGLATELEANGHDLSDRLWSARLLLTDPDAIEAVHLAYFRAGARVTTTASYQASIEGFAAAGLDRHEALRLIALSVARAPGADSLSRRVGRRRSLLVAGSVGPYGAMLADGSEYRGDYDPGATALTDFHRPRIEALVAAGADLLAFETIPTVREAEVLVGLSTRSPSRPGSATRAGTGDRPRPGSRSRPRSLSARTHDRRGRRNCTAPRHLPALLAAADRAERPLIAYPNGGERWDPASRRWLAEDGGAYDPATVASWAGLGATWLGGCCGTGPGDIAVLAQRVRAA